MADPQESDLDVQSRSATARWWAGWGPRADVDPRSFARTAGSEDARVAIPVGDSQSLWRCLQIWPSSI
jgi:hypothetical protein